MLSNRRSCPGPLELCTGKLHAALTWSMGFSGLVCWLILLMFPWSYTRSSRRNSAWRWQPSKLCQSRLVPEIMNTSKFIAYSCPIGMFFSRNLTCLTSTGFCRRHLTWYQWVSASVGAVDSQTVAPLPMNATSNQNAKPWTIPELFKQKKHESKLFEKLC